MEQNILQSIRESIAVKEKLAEQKADDIAVAVEMLISSLRNGGRIHFAGNGGSAADAQHLAAELSGRFRFNRPPLNAEALHCNTSYLTAAANDFGFVEAYARLLKGTAQRGDVLVAISTSGNSENILCAARAARAMGVQVIALTGETGGKLKEYADLLINVPSHSTPRIQECHILVGHILCELVERELFEEN
ncbi:MAG: SIS domain-containing protein [Bacteroidales bacterium]|nr:SIS domain-containing protein [Bacteroidales bacterium]